MLLLSFDNPVFAAYANAAAETGQEVRLVVHDGANEARARELVTASVLFERHPYGDIWLRDTGPLALFDGSARRFARKFRFNGWGGKYVLPHDTEVSAAVARAAGIEASAMPWVLEGGSIEVDGQGTCLTTEQCLLNPNRNPGMTREQLEHGLAEALGVSKVLWLEDGLLNDHTDGHIDTIARFVAPGKVVCMEAAGKSDPNHDVMAQIARDLSAMTDALGQKLAVARIPSPGAVLDDDGRVMPASYLNFYIANTTVVVPTYGSPADRVAVEALEAYFPHRKVVGLSAKACCGHGLDRLSATARLAAAAVRAALAGARVREAETDVPGRTG